MPELMQTVLVLTTYLRARRTSERGAASADYSMLVAGLALALTGALLALGVL